MRITASDERLIAERAALYFAIIHEPNGAHDILLNVGQFRDKADRVILEYHVSIVLCLDQRFEQRSEPDVGLGSVMAASPNEKRL
jgi:hypothetical protein